MNIRSVLRVATVTIIALSACSSDSATPTTTTTTTTSAGIDGVQMYTGLTQNHVRGSITYPQSPPVGGDHNPVWQNCGAYDDPVQNENAVHSLEHGAVWLAYRPDLPADQVAVLRSFAVGHSHVLVSPYVGLTDAVVATAWGKQLRLDSVTDPRLAEFVAMYEQGPQTPEPGAPCSGGIGEPVA